MKKIQNDRLRIQIIVVFALLILGYFFLFVTVPKEELKSNRISNEDGLASIVADENYQRQMDSYINDILRLKETIAKAQQNIAAQTASRIRHDSEYVTMVANLDIAENLRAAESQLDATLRKIQAVSTSRNSIAKKMAMMANEYQSIDAVKSSTILDLEIIRSYSFAEQNVPAAEIFEKVITENARKDLLNETQKETLGRLSKNMAADASITTVGTVFQTTLLGGTSQKMTYFEKTVSFADTQKEFFVNEYIDKNITGDNSLTTASIRNLPSEGSFSVVLPDPLIRWQFKEKKSASVKYVVAHEVSPEKIKNTQTVVTATAAVVASFDTVEISVQEATPSNLAQLEIIVPQQLYFGGQKDFTIPMIMVNTGDTVISGISIDMVQSKSEQGLEITQKNVPMIPPKSMVVVFANVVSQGAGVQKYTEMQASQSKQATVLKQRIYFSAENSVVERSAFERRLKEFREQLDANFICNPLNEVLKNAEGFAAKKEYGNAVKIADTGMQTCAQFLQLNNR